MTKKYWSENHHIAWFNSADQSWKFRETRPNSINASIIKIAQNLIVLAKKKEEKKEETPMDRRGLKMWWGKWNKERIRGKNVF